MTSIDRLVGIFILFHNMLHSVENSESRRRILDAAAYLFGRHGYRGTSMEMIAERAGIAKASIYHYFPSKRRLYTTLLERAIESLDELAAEQAAGGANRPLALVAKYLRRNQRLLGVVIATHAAGFGQLKKLVGPGHARRIERRHREVFGARIGGKGGRGALSLLGELVECVMLGLGLKLMYGRQTDVEAVLGLLERLIANGSRLDRLDNDDE